MSREFDLVVLGTGRSVAMVESWDVGGTCPLRGCVPKKVLVAAAQVLHQIERAPLHHIEVGTVALDWAKLIARERTFVDGVPEAFAASLENRGIELVRGRARFGAAHRLEVDGETLEAGKIVIATGSKPRPLAIPGAEHLITSDDLLEMRELPDSLVFIGGGVIALEFSHILARAGTRVTILEALPRLLPAMDADAVAKLHEESERIGIEVLTGVQIEAVTPAGYGLEVRFAHQGANKSLVAGRVANGTGRVPDLDELDLEAGGVAHDGPRIAVDEHLRSVSNGDVYVAGDALWSSPQLSPIATYEGRLVGENIVNGDTRRPEYGHIPATVFTVPALASVGLTEAAAAQQGLDFDAKATDMVDFRSSMSHAESVAYAKVLIEKGSKRILGAHLVGHGAEEVIHLFAFAIEHGIGAEALGASVYAYPTFASDLKYML